MRFSYFSACCLLLFGFTTAEAAFTIRDGKVVDASEVATLSVEEHYRIAVAAMEHEDWPEAVRQFSIVTANFPRTPHAQEGAFYLGVAHFQVEDYDFANDAFSNYLKANNNPRFFEETLQYKFAIACQFKAGAKKHFFGTKQLPKWASGRDHALTIFDEVIAAVPCHDLAAWSLYSKAEMLAEDRIFRESVEVYQQLIRRFPKHELAPESYLAISDLYITQSNYEMQNPDLLAFAQINLRRFKQDFPREERLALAEQNLMILKETYANSLYQTGLLYERKQHPRASIIYYKSAIAQFPETSTAQLCQKRLEQLNGDLVPSEDGNKAASAPAVQTDHASS